MEMNELGITRPQAIELLKKYNTDAFHLQHALTVEAVMGWFADYCKSAEQAPAWQMAGLLHDIDFEKYPDQHCQKCVELLSEAQVSPSLIRSICSHGWGSCSQEKPETQMEKVLFAVDELTGLIGAAALMRPSKSTQDMELKSLKKKFKDKRFAAGCSREVIGKGAELLGWELDDLLSRTLEAMQASETAVAKESQKL